MADRRAFEPVVFSVSELPSGVPIARGLKGGRGCLRRAFAFENLYLIQRACTARDCTCVEEFMKQFCLGVIVAMGLTLPAFGQGVDPYIGTWKLNVEKSTSSLPMFKSLTLTITGEGQNRTLIAEGVDATGQSGKTVFLHIYDGMPHATTGNLNFDASAYARIGNIVNVVRFKTGKPVSVGQSILVHGKSYTFTSDYELNGQLNHDVLVYDRQ